MKQLILFISLFLALLLPSCIEDGITTSPSSQPEFSTDTLDLGLVFTAQSTPTHKMVVYNRHDKILNISSISLRDGGKGLFRINVDGVAGTSFSNMEIRPNDSIYVFVEATIPPADRNIPFDVDDKLDFVTNGVTSTVVLTATGRDVTRLRGLVVTADTTLTADRPFQIFDSLVVAPGATLTLAPGTSLHFHDKAGLTVYGTLRSDGSAASPVVMTGDRTDNVVSDIPFDVMSRQWDGVRFLPGSKGNFLSHTVIKNTVNGVIADSLGGDASAPAVTIHNCRFRNSGAYAFVALHSAVSAVGTEFADASSGVIFLHGGVHSFNHCTFANYYLFTAIGGPALTLSHTGAGNATDVDDSGLPLLSARFANCIIYGLGSDINHPDLAGTDIFIDRCLFRSDGSDDDNFRSCIWNEDPLYYTVREDYIFDYRLRPESPAAFAADPALTLPAAALDFYGVPRGPEPSLGAFQFLPADDSSDVDKQ